MDGFPELAGPDAATDIYESTDQGSGRRAAVSKIRAQFTIGVEYDDALLPQILAHVLSGFIDYLKVHLPSKLRGERSSPRKLVVDLAR